MVKDSETESGIGMAIAQDYCMLGVHMSLLDGPFWPAALDSTEISNL